MDLDALGQFPDILQRVVNATPRDLWQRRGSDGGFALVENAHHLADLEEEGFGARIDRILEENEPFLPDFAGDEIAKERRYLELDIEPALERFRAAREANRLRLLTVQPEQWSRCGTQEHVGTITLTSLPHAMLSHDRTHARQIADLLRELNQPVPQELEDFGSGEDGRGIQDDETLSVIA
jgi:hypothetical protein